MKKIRSMMMHGEIRKRNFIDKIYPILMKNMKRDKKLRKWWKKP